MFWEWTCASGRVFWEWTCASGRGLCEWTCASGRVKRTCGGQWCTCDARGGLTRWIGCVDMWWLPVLCGN